MIISLHFIKETTFVNILFKKNIKNTKHLFYVLFPKAMLKKPVVTEVRTPTNTWSGLGFSKSMPAETIKELRRANHVSYKPTMTTTFEVCTVVPYPFFLSVLSANKRGTILYLHKEKSLMVICSNFYSCEHVAIKLIQRSMLLFLYTFFKSC